MRNACISTSPLSMSKAGQGRAGQGWAGRGGAGLGWAGQGKGEARKAQAKQQSTKQLSAVQCSTTLAVYSNMTLCIAVQVVPAGRRLHLSHVLYNCMLCPVHHGCISLHDLFC